jgi:hypothetical protein
MIADVSRRLKRAAMNFGAGARPACALLALLAIAGLSPRTASARECDLSSTAPIKVSRPASDDVVEQVVAPAEIEKIADVRGIRQSPHRLIVVSETIDAHFALANRVVELSPTQFCNAPQAITISFGVFRRSVFITREAAADDCVRAALLRHEAQHLRSVDEAVDAFLQQHQDQIRLAVTSASEAAAPTRGDAVHALKTNLMAFLNRMLQQFMEQELSGIKRGADSASHLAELRNACDGRVLALERRLFPGTDL